MIEKGKVRELSGQWVSLRQLLAERPLTLLLFYNNDCLGCTGRALPLAYEIASQYPQLQVLGIHSDFGERKGSAENIPQVFSSGVCPFPIYIDESHRLYDAFQCEGTPHWVLLDEQGMALLSVFGSQQNAQNRLFYRLMEIFGTA